MENKRKLNSVLEGISYWSMVCFVLDVILFGTGALTKNIGIPTRMIFFGISLLTIIPLLIQKRKEFFHNKYFTMLFLFAVVLLIAMIVGIKKENSGMILKSDLSGFLNMLIFIPFFLLLNKRESIVRFIKIITISLSVMGIMAIVLSFYQMFPSELRQDIYGFTYTEGIASITLLGKYVARIVFHNATRLSVFGFLFALYFSVQNKSKKAFWILNMVCNMIAIFISYTRSVYLAFGVVSLILAVLIFVYYKKMFMIYLKNVVIMSVITLIAIGLLGVTQHGSNLYSVMYERCILAISDPYIENSDDKVSNTDDIEEETLTNIENELTNLQVRNLRKEMAISNFKKHPLLGCGLGTVNDENGNHIEYFYYDLLSKIGIIGVLLFLLPAFISFAEVMLLRDVYSKEQRIIALHAQLALLSMIIMSYFNPCMNTSTGLWVYMFAICSSIPWREQHKTSKIIISATNHYDIRWKDKKKSEDIFVTSDFSHMEKAYYTINMENAIQLHSWRYTKNISFARIISLLLFSHKAYWLMVRLCPQTIIIEIPNNSLAVVGAKYRRIYGGYLSFDIFDMWPEAFPKKVTNPIVKLGMNVWKYCRNHYLKYADHITTECDYFRQILRMENIEVECETEYIKVPQLISSPEWEYNHEQVELCYIGSVNNILDYDLMVSFLKAIVEKKKTVLHLIGKGEKIESLVNELERNGIQVEFYGELYDSKKIRGIMNKCSFGLNLLKENLAIGVTMKSITFFQAGLPIINTVDGDTRMFVDKYQIGINLNRSDLDETVDKILLLNQENIMEMKKNVVKMFNQLFMKE